MKRLLFYSLFCLLYSVRGYGSETSTLSKEIEIRIAQVKQRHGDERRKAMNELKTLLRTLNVKQRRKAMHRLRTSLTSHTKTNPPCTPASHTVTQGANRFRYRHANPSSMPNGTPPPHAPKPAVPHPQVQPKPTPTNPKHTVPATPKSRGSVPAAPTRGRP